MEEQHRSEEEIEEMRAEYAALGIPEDGRVDPDDWDELAETAYDGNWFSIRRCIRDHMDGGDAEGALLMCIEAAMNGDTEAVIGFVSDPRTKGCRVPRIVDPAAPGIPDVYSVALGCCPGFAGRVTALSATDVRVAEDAARALRFDTGHRDEYGICLSNGLSMGSPVSMHMRASDILSPGFSGSPAGDVSEALDLMERSSEGYWRAALVMGQLHHTGRYVPRDDVLAARYVARACRLTREEAPRQWLRYLTRGPYDDGLHVVDRGYGTPEVKVLIDITASWGGHTRYAAFANGRGCFEDGTFAMGPGSRRSDVPDVLFKPTGLSVRFPRRDLRSDEDLLPGELRHVLRLCIESARDSIRGLGA